jgi:hypothetical protein
MLYDIKISLYLVNPGNYDGFQKPILLINGVPNIGLPSLVSAVNPSPPVGWGVLPLSRTAFLDHKTGGVKPMKKSIILSVIVASSIGLAACGDKAKETATGAVDSAVQSVDGAGNMAMGAAAGVGNVVGGVTDGAMGAAAGAAGAVGGAAKAVGGSAVDAAAGAAKGAGVPAGAADAAANAAKGKM